MTFADYVWKSARPRSTALARLKYLEEGFINPITVKNLNPKSILNYLKAVNLTSNRG
jgi:hypothetical protein